MFSLASFIVVFSRAIGYVQKEWLDREKPTTPEEGEERGEGEEGEGEKKDDGEEKVLELEGDQLLQRIEDNIDSITRVCYDYLRRGLFDRHKIIISSILCFRIQVKSEAIEKEK